MKPITKDAWGRVLEKACDIANAATADDDVLLEVHTARMLELLDEMELEFGMHSKILDTRADYLEDPEQRRDLYLRALALARQADDSDEVDTILESLKNLEDNLQS